MLQWNMACLLDGSGNLLCENKVMVPHLGFEVDGDDDVVFDQGTTVFHELLDLDGLDEE